jgi:hypothetical protein
LTTITSRIGSAPAAGATRRVATTGAAEGASASLGGDSWGATWGGTWGRTWLGATPAAVGASASPAVDVTPRVAFAALTTNLLLLEGDESGYLLLEGDAQSGADQLMLEGDETEASRNTRRVTI